MQSMNVLPYTVLIVDADTTIRTSMADVLSSLCFTQEATSVEEARALLDMVPVHVLLTRDQLPDGDGVALCAFTTERLPETIRILYGHAPTLERAMTAINQGQVWRYLDAQWDSDLIFRTAKQAIDLYNSHASNSMLIEQLRTANEVLVRKVEQRTRELVALGEDLRIALDQMQALVATDELTGLSNRRVMIERLTELFRQARRYQTPLTCLVCDFAQFKNFNAEYGTDKGDAVLQEAAHRLATHIRDVDILGRAGGDEFVLILPHTNSAQARVVAERLYQVLANTPYQVTGVTSTFTVHIGIAEITTSVADAAELYSRAVEAEHTARVMAVSPSISIYPDPENADPAMLTAGSGRRTGE